MRERATPAGDFTISTVDRKILAKLQGDFPVCECPYAEAAREVGISEEELLQRLEQLLAAKVLTRFGPMFQIEEMGGAFVLAALAAPEDRYDEVTALVNALPQVAHNYRREHALNMWFVLATETKAGIAEAIARIECDTGLPVYAFPKEREFFVEMKLEARL
jgi:siroheme decarboxylase